MADAFICYARTDRDFALKLRDGLGEHKREVRIDLTDIQPTKEWWTEICTHIEEADNFIFVISPDSCASDTCREEVAYAKANHKRLVPVVYSPAGYKELPPAIARLQWISFAEAGFETAFQSLIQALDTDFDWVRSHTRALVRAREWGRNGRDNSFLLRGMDLQNAIQWLAQAPTIKEPKLLALQEEYIRASQKREAEELEQAQRRERVATSRELVAYALNSLDEDPERSLLLSMHAVAVTWSHNQTALPESEGTVHEALLRSRIRLTLLGHESSVNSVAWSPDGKRLASASDDNAVKVWEAGSGRELRTLKRHGSRVNSVDWSPDGERLASASDDNTVKVWDVGRRRELLTLKGHGGWVKSVAWSPDGKHLASASDDNTVRVWEAGSGRELLTLKGHESRVNNVAWSPDGKRLASASDDNTVKVGDVGRRRELLTLKGHEGCVKSVAWSPDGKRLASASDDNTVKVWEAVRRRELLTLKGHGGSIKSVAWSPDGKHLASASDDNTLKVWEAGSGRELLTLKGHEGKVRSVEVHVEDPRWWEGDKRKFFAVTEHEAGVNSVAWSPDGKRLASASEDKTVKVWEAVWEASSGRELLTLKGHGGSIKSVAWSADGKRLASASEDEALKVWEAGSGRELLTLKGHWGFNSVAWNPKLKRLASASDDNTVEVWESENGRELLTLNRHERASFRAAGHSNPGIRSVAWSPEGKRLASASEDKAVNVWVGGGKLLTLSGRIKDITETGHEAGVNSVAWSPYGDLLASASDDNTVKVWYVGSWKGAAAWLKGSSVNHPLSSFNSAGEDDRRRLTAAEVWEEQSGRQLRTLKGHGGSVNSVAWSPEGERLASASDDNTVKVWEAKSGRELLTLKRHGSRVNSVAWSPDGKRLASAGDDWIVQVYAMDIELLMSLACSRVTRNLTPDECRKYLHLDEAPPIPFSGALPLSRTIRRDVVKINVPSPFG